jgi:hypothetical protein
MTNTTTNATDTVSSLYDSDTAEYLTAEDLSITDDEYEALCSASAASSEAEGHVRTSTGRRVYAE